MKKNFGIILLCLFVLLGVCSQAQPEKQSWRRICNGRDCSIYNRTIINIESQFQLDSIVAKDKLSEYKYVLKSDTVDFEKEFVLVYYAGSSNNGAVLDNVKMEDNKMLVKINLIVLGAKCTHAKLLVSPYNIFAIDKAYKNSVYFEETNVFSECE